MSYSPKMSAVPVMGNVGEIIIPSTDSPTLDWKINHFFTTLELVNSIDSPTFYFKSIPMKIKLFHGSKKQNKNSEKWFELCLLNAEDLTTGIHFIRRIGIRKNDGFAYKVIELQGETHGVYLLPVSEFLKSRDDLSSLEGHVSFFLEFHHHDDSTQADPSVLSLSDESSSTPSAVSGISVIPMSGEFPSTSVGVYGRTGRNGLEKLSKNLKDLYLNERHCDMAIQVCERQFKTHTSVLCARSPVFDKKMHEMLKSGTNALIVTICKPEIFHEFLLYLYSGYVETLSDSNVIGLYKVSREYGVEDLKADCVDYMKRNLSVDIFCDIVELATACNEAELLALSKEYFTKNTKRILLSAKWKIMLKENSSLANDLFLLMVPDD